MLFTTPTQWLALAVALVAGWLFGLASHPGGRKWKQRYAEERDIHGRSRKEYDARIAENDARIRELEQENARGSGTDARIRELEQENARLVAAPPAAIPAEQRVARAPRNAPRPAGSTGGRWFDWSDRDRPIG